MSADVPVYSQEFGKFGTRTLIGTWSGKNLPEEVVEMSFKVDPTIFASVHLGTHEGKPAWIILTHPTPKTSTRMNRLISVAVGRKCMWLSPWLEGELLKVWLPNGEVLAYENGDEADIAHLEAHLKLRGL